MTNSGIILVLAYPETIVTVADEWYSPFMRFIGIGKKNYVRAGHAALVLINKATGELEYHDFGRYITPEPNGRVRGKTTDHELDFPLKANLVNGSIENLDEIWAYLATNPIQTHGEGTMLASVCDKVDYDRARSHITMMQQRDFIRYAAFIKDACNCARFVTDTLIASITDDDVRSKLIRSKRFTPSTYGNVINADTQNYIYEVTAEGKIGPYSSNIRKDNFKYFLDRLIDHQPSFIGTLQPKANHEIQAHAQWLSGIAAGAWFELYRTESEIHYRFRRISPYGYIDVNGIYEIDDTSFSYELEYKFVHYSNCHFFHVEQESRIYRFELKEKLN